MTARFDIDDLDQDERRLRRAATWLDEQLCKSSAARAVELAEQAARTARAMIRARARAYIREPGQLAHLGNDLSELPPKHLVTALAYIARNPTLYRWIGYGGEIPAINLRAAMLCARFRRFHRIKARKAT